MENIYAVMILHKAKQKIDEVSIKKILEAANAKIDEIRIKALINLLKGVDIEKAIENIILPIQPVIEQIEEKTEIIEEHKEDTKTEEITSGLDRLFG